MDGIKIGKEYYIDDKVLFEGEYLDEKRWNGKLYNKENDCFFLIKNGNGIVKEYNKYGDLIFEGEYLNGKLWNGILKEYSKGSICYNMNDRGCSYCQRKFFKSKGVYEKAKEYNNKLKYEGEYLYGKRNGKGKEYDANGNLIYEGEYLDGERKSSENIKKIIII